MYLTFQEYTQFGGTLNETSFNDYEFKARTKVDWYTFNRLQNETTYLEAVKRCVYSLINLLLLQDQAGSVSADGNNGTKAGIASQSNDGVSVSYNVLSAQQAIENVEKEVRDTVEQYLQGVVNSLGQKVLYRGVYGNE